MKKKFSPAQIKAQKKFAQMAKSGKLAKLRKKSSSKSKKKSTTKKIKNRVKPSKTKRSRGGSASDIDRSLLLAINDPKVKEIRIIK